MAKNMENIVKKLSKNYWAIAAIILAVILVVILVANSGVGKTAAGEKVMTFAQQQGAEATLVEVNEKNGLYEVILLIQGQQAPVYVTQDGEALVLSLVPLTGQATAPTDTPSQTQPPQEVTKSDKPKLEAIVTPYCPYGLQYMKGLIPVYELMKDKADISIISLGVTHMENEQLETKRQICINNKYSKDIMFSYIKELIYDETSEICYANYHSGEHQGDVAYFDKCMAPAISSIMEKLNINEDKIDTCINEEGQGLYDSAVDYSRSKGAGGSPSPFLNNVKLSAGRSPEAIKTALCNAFNEAPEECATELSSETPAPGITASTTSGTNTNAQC